MSKVSAKCARCNAAFEVELTPDSRAVCPHCGAALGLPGAPKPAARADPRIGTRLADFEIVESLAALGDRPGVSPAEGTRRMSAAARGAADPQQLRRPAAGVVLVLGLAAAALGAWAIFRPGPRPGARGPEPVESPPPALHPRDPFEREREATPQDRPLPRLDPPQPSTPDPPPPPRAAFQGTLRVLPDGRLDIGYDFASAAELRDWRHASGGEPSVVEGEVRFGGPGGNCLMFNAPFTGDIEIAGTWRQLQVFQRECDCSINFCNLGGERYYAASLAIYGTRIFKNNGHNEVSKKLWECVGGRSHQFRIVREGESIRVWVDGELQAEAKDAEYTSGSVGVGAWFARVAIEEIRITGRLDPGWLAQNAGARAQIEAARKAGGK